MDTVDQMPPNEPGVELVQSILALELATIDSHSSTEVAAAAARVLEKLAHHFARIIGDVGVEILLARSAITIRSRFPWIDGAAVSDARLPWIALQKTLAHRDADEASRAFAELLTTFIGLMTRFIGESLVAQLLQELWPGFLPQVEQEMA